LKIIYKHLIKNIVVVLLTLSLGAKSAKEMTFPGKDCEENSPKANA